MLLDGFLILFGLALLGISLIVEAVNDWLRPSRHEGTELRDRLRGD